MVRVSFLILALVFLSGCETFKVKTEVQKQNVPVPYCPAPPEIVRPVLPIHTMTESQKQVDGEVAKYWKATAITLIDYSKELEDALNGYNNINITYEDLQKLITQPNTEE